MVSSKVPYSRKCLQENIFANFTNRLLFTKIFPMNILVIQPNLVYYVYWGQCYEHDYGWRQTSTPPMDQPRAHDLIAQTTSTPRSTASVSLVARVVTGETMIDDAVPLLWARWFSITQAGQFTVTVVPASTIAAANKVVKKVLDSDMGPSEKDAACSSCHEAYEHFTPKEKARIGKRAEEDSITATIHFFSKMVPGHISFLKWSLGVLSRKAAREHGRRNMKRNWQRIREQVKRWL